MPAENDGPKRTASPLSAARSPSASSRVRQKEEDLLSRKDKNYRRYASAVERVLAQFETAVEEWADYISFLGRLLKALSLRPPGSSEIAHKQLVAKRLSQCLNPVLPSGVHQKTLEVYSYIFTALGRDGLSDDLSLYLPGLAPTLSFTSLSVKPNILVTFETHIVQCHHWALRSALKALILALLPCLEEENSDEFEWALRILETLKASIAPPSDDEKVTQDTVGVHFFWQSLFLTCMTSRSRRAGALAYLTRKLPRLGPRPEAEDTKASKQSHGDRTAEGNEDLKLAVQMVASPEPGLLIRCFCAGLQDEQSLTQRGFLDLLVTHLPLNSPVFEGASVAKDLERLVSAATSVVARRDMSLNRRLWSWFLGPEPADGVDHQVKSPTSPHSSNGRDYAQDVANFQIRYFERFGLQPLVGSILGLARSKSPQPQDRSKPFRICLSLMDRWEIGGTIAPHIFNPCMESAWQYSSMSVPKAQKSEVLKSASTFFDSVESATIWAELTRLVSKALDSENPRSCEQLELVLFVFTQFNVREEEMQMIHLPLVVLYIILRLPSRQEASSRHFNVPAVLAALKVAQKLLGFIPARAFAVESESGAPLNGLDNTLQDPQGMAGRIASFYSETQSNSDLRPPFPASIVGQLILYATERFALQAVRSSFQELLSVREAALGVLSSVISRSSSVTPRSSDLQGLFGPKSVRPLHDDSIDPDHFPVTIAKVGVLDAIFGSISPSAWLSTDSVRRVIPILVAELWPALSPSSPNLNVDAVQCIWRLHAMYLDNSLVESTFVTLIVSRKSEVAEDNIDFEGFQKFVTLWSHSPPTSASAQSQSSRLKAGKTASSRNDQVATDLPLLEQPLFLFLDLLGDESSLLRPYVVSWLQSLGSIRLIVDLILNRLTELDFVRSISLHARRGKGDRPSRNLIFSDGPDTCLYYLKILQHLMQYSAATIWPALAYSSAAEGDDDSVQPNQELIAFLSLQILRYRNPLFEHDLGTGVRINDINLFLLRQLLQGPISSAIVERMIEEPLIEELRIAIEGMEHGLQEPLMETILAALQARKAQTAPAKSPRAAIPLPPEPLKTGRNLTVNTDPLDRRAPLPQLLQVPGELLDVIKLGISSPSSRPVLDHWISFVNQCLPLYEGGIFQILIPLAECYCTTLSSVFTAIQNTFTSTQVENNEASEPVVGHLLNGLEQSLATAHDALTINEPGTAPVKTPEQHQSGFFGNMVSNVFSGDNRSKSLTANNRLTVLLCFKDAIRICYSMWSWGDTRRDDKNRKMAASYNHIILRLRNRTRRLFEHLFAAEALECLETVIDLWQRFKSEPGSSQATNLLDLLNVLESSRPKVTIPAIFNAIYSRTNPSALDPSRKSTLTSSLSDTTLATFLVAYVRSLEDDTMDEIWADCLTFLKDVLANPMPHRQTIPRLIEFTAVLGEKVDNTTFGEQRKMRRELGELFVRLLAAALTTRPVGFSQESARSSTPDLTKGRASLEYRGAGHSSSLVTVLATVVPNISKVLVDSDRVASTTSTISTSVMSPIFRSKAFPENVEEDALDLLTGLLRISEASKAAKKDVGDAFNDPKFFSGALPLVEKRWLPLLRSWSLADKERMPELLSRLTAPATAGIMFGVGATSARLEADRRTQLNLRRIATLILAADADTFVVNLGGLQQKLVELLGATSSSSPSNVTRAEVYMVLRALAMKTTMFHLAALWPAINAELYDALASSYPASSSASAVAAAEALPPVCLLQACKLLDALLTLNPEDFQLQAWLFISDTTDAVYRPSSDAPVALVDDLAEALDAKSDGAQLYSLPAQDAEGSGRRPLLVSAAAKGVPREELVQKVVHPFFRQLSIYAFESTYGLQPPDWDACFHDLLQDLFDDSTLV